MNIILLTSLLTSSGGARQALYLAEGLVKKGHTVTFFTPPKSSLREKNLSINWQDLPSSFCKAKKALEGAFSKSEPNIVHAFHNRGVKLAAYCGTLWAIKGLPVACAAHRGVLHRPGNPLPYLLPGIKRFIVNSKACAKVLPLLWRKKRACVVYNSIPPERLMPTESKESILAELNIPKDSFIFGTVASVHPIKGVSFFLKGFAQIKEKNKFLVFVGSKPEKFMPLVKELGIEENTRIVDFNNHIADYLNIFDVFVLPSLSESQPNTLLEAMCAGLPAVCTNVGGVPDVIACKELLVPPANADALAKAMQLIYENKELRTRAAAENLKFSEHLKPEYRISEIEKIYKEMLAEVGI